MGAMDKLVRQGIQFQEETNRGNVILVPDLFWKDYKLVMTNLDKQEFEKSHNYSFRLAMKNMTHIRASYGIEREFERYYQRLVHK